MFFISHPKSQESRRERKIAEWLSSLCFVRFLWIITSVPFPLLNLKKEKKGWKYLGLGRDPENVYEWKQS